MKLGDAVDPRLPWVRAFHDLDEAWAAGTAAARVDGLRRVGRRIGDTLRASGRVVGVKTLNNVTLPYPTRFAFNGAVPLPWPMVIMVHRTLLVQVETDEGEKNVLFNPTDNAAARRAPFFAKLREKIERFAPFAEKLLAKEFEPLEEQLAGAGVRPEDVHLIAYDHFHTQDLRPVLGASNGARGRFPNALLLAPRREWRDWDGLHPMQRPWFIEDGKRGVPAERVVLTDADLALGRGCLLVRTPGHTSGNQTLVVSSDEGVFGTSENGTSADNWNPHASDIPGLRRYVEHYGYEVVLNSNTPEMGGDQYCSMVLERALVDPVPGRPDHVQMFPSSEVTPSALAPGIRPSMIFGHRDGGRFARAPAPSQRGKEAPPSRRSFLGRR
jgi:glyoxylase-like metal-dependent hydrolase (beta-lactamase superfamily II)